MSTNKKTPEIVATGPEDFLLKSKHHQMSPSSWVDAMAFKQDLDEATSVCSRFFPIVSAIQEHIKEAPKGKCAFVDNSQHKLYYRRGVGPIEFKDLFLFRDWLSKKREVISLGFQLIVKFDTDDDEYDNDAGVITTETRVDVPIELVINFNQKGFNKWVQEVLDKRLEEAQKADQKSLRNLLRKNRNSKWLKKLLEEETK